MVVCRNPAALKQELGMPLVTTLSNNPRRVSLLLQLVANGLYKLVNLMRTPKRRKDLHLKPNTPGSKKDQQKQYLYYSLLVFSTVQYKQFTISRGYRSGVEQSRLSARQTSCTPAPLHRFRELAGRGIDNFLAGILRRRRPARPDAQINLSARKRNLRLGCGKC